MGKVKWGVIAAVIVAAVILIRAAPELFSPGEEPETPVAESTSSSGESGTPAAEPASSSDGSSTAAVESTSTDEDASASAGASGPTGDESREAGDATAALERIERENASDAPEPAGESAGDQSAARSSTTPTPPDDDPDPALQQEAESFVERLAEPSDEPVAVDRAEAFVGADRPLVSEASESAADTMPRVAADEIEAEQQPSRVAAGDIEAEDQAPRPEATASRPDEVVEPQTSGRDMQSADPGLDAAAAVDEDAVQTRAAGSAVEPAEQSVVDLPLSEETPVTIAELLGPQEDIPSDAVFYVHTVDEDDKQGIWGIVHHGIAGNFAEGVAIHRGETTETYRIDIPPDADERRPDSSSSFLGKLIYEKSRASYVYNFQADRLGRNPDLIIPGQEIVIVAFTPEELVAVYKHFVGGQE